MLTHSLVKRVGDLGDLPTQSQDGPGNRRLIEAATRSIVAAGAVPILLGGLFKRMYGLNDTQLAQVFPGASARDLGLV